MHPQLHGKHILPPRLATEMRCVSPEHEAPSNGTGVVAMLARKILHRLLPFCTALLAVALVAGILIGYRVWPRELRVTLQPRFPALAMEGNRLILAFSPDVASAKIATFNDQLEAFLHFEYLRGREGARASQILLPATHTERAPSSAIFVVLEN